MRIKKVANLKISEFKFINIPEFAVATRLGRRGTSGSALAPAPAPEPAPPFSRMLDRRALLRESGVATDSPF